MPNHKQLNKPNQLVALKTKEKVTTIQRKLYNVFLVIAQQKVKFAKPDMEIDPDESYWFEVDCLDAHKVAGIGHKDLNYIEEELEELMRIIATVREKDNRDQWDKFSILPRIRKEGYYYEFKLEGVVVEALRTQNYFTPLYLMMLQDLDSQYSITLYELAMRYQDCKIPKMSVEEFREITNTTDQYRRFYDFRRRVLDPACEEVSEKTNLNLSYETEKRGRRIAYINFETEIKEDILLGEGQELDGYDKQANTAIKRLIGK